MTNSENNKRIAKNTAMLYVRMLLIMGVTLYTSRVVLQVLGIEDFGIYNVVAGFVSMLGFFSSSLSNVTQRYLSIEIGNNNINGARKAFSQSFFLFAIISFLLLVSGETIGLWFIENKLVIPTERLTAAWWIFQFSLVTTILSILQIPFMSAIIAREKMSVYAYIGIIEVLLKLCMTFSLLYLETLDHLITYAILIALVQTIISLSYIIYCLHRFPESHIMKFWNNTMVRDMGSFICYNLFGCFAWSAGVQGVNIILNIFFGPAVNAARAVAVQVNAAISSFTGNIMTAIKPQIIKSYSTGDKEYMYTLIERSSKCAYFFMLILATPILFQTTFILGLWLKTVPHYSDTFVQIMIIESLFAVLVSPLWIAANATGKIKNNQVYGRLITLSVLPISYLFLHFFHNPIIPFVITVIAQAFYWIYNLIDIHKQIGLGYTRYFKSVVLPILITSIPLMIVVSIICNYLQNDFSSFLLVSIGSITIALILIYTVGIEQMERKIINSQINKYLHKFSRK